MEPMTSSQDLPRPRRRWVRWLFAVAIGGVAGLLALLLALPWIIEVPAMQRLLASLASRVVAPGAVRFGHLSVFWNRPTEIDGLVLRDAQGDDIVASPQAHFSWSLRQILLSRPASATLTLDQAAVDIERSANGKVDLLETLKPILKDEPDLTLLVRVVGVNLRFRNEGLDQPFLADKADIELDINAYPQPIAWRMKLERAGQNAEPGSVQIQGSMSREKETDGLPEDLELAIKGNHWPWAYTSAGIKARGAFSGTIDARHRSGKLVLGGDAQVLGLHTTGSALSGDELHLDTITAVWRAGRQAGIWTAERLDVTAPVGTIKASGSFPPAHDRGAHLEGNLDLAALARQIPRTMRLRDDLRLEKGSVELRADVSGDAGKAGQTILATARLSDLTARHGAQSLSLRDPATFTARLHRQTDSLSLEELDVQTPFLTATGRGDLDRGINVSATIDLGAASQRLHDWVDLGRIELAGQGKITAKYQRIATRFEIGANAELKGLSASGLPAVETLHRDKVVATLAVKGGAAPSGLPTSLHDLSLTGQSDLEELTLSARRDQPSGVVAIDSRAQTQLVAGGKQQKAEAAVQAHWGDKEVTLEQIVVSLAPIVGPGGQFLPGEPARWSGKGRYDIAQDELTITADSGPAGARAAPLALTPTLVRVGGLKAREAAWLDVNLTGDVPAMGSLAGLDQPRLAGLLSGLLQGRQNAEGWEFAAGVQVRDLAQLSKDGTRTELAKNAAASVRGTVARKLERLDFSELAVVTPYGQIEGAGPVTDLAGTPRFDLRGTLSPDWKALSELLARKVEPNASITGSPRAWRIAGTLPKSGNQHLLAGMNGELGVNLEQVDVFGMRLGRTAAVVRVQDGKTLIDPIDSTLNAGRLHLEPTVMTDKQGHTWLHLGTSSGLFDAVVNDEVSHRVLMFVAPVLDQATRVRGRVSLALNEAFLPIGAGPEAQAKIDGDVLFDSVEFMPGPLAEQILGVFRQEQRPLLVLRDPVSVRIVGRKIYQEGLIIPLANVAAIGIEGWVDFDQNLNLVASFAMVPPRRNIPFLSDILENAQLQLPITGTFQKPRIDGDAIKDRFKDLGVNMLDSVIGAGVNGLGRILQGGPRRNGPQRDFFPPFVAPGSDQPLPLPPGPGAPASRGNPPAAGAARAPAPPPPPAPGDRRVQPVPDNPDDELDQPNGRPGQLTPQQRQMQREERRARRLEKRAERRLRRGLPPE